MRRYIDKLASLRRFIEYMLTPKSHPLQWRHTGVMASQITGNTTICSTAFFSLTTKETSKARIIGTLLCWPVDSPPKGPVTQKTLSRHNHNMFHVSCHRGVGLPQLNLQFKFKFSSIGNRKWNHSLLIGCRPDETVFASDRQHITIIVWSLC